MKKAVFFDRDGVLNEALIRNGKPYSPRIFSEFTLVAEAAPALESLQRSGFWLVVVTNQPDIARGKMARRELKRMHRQLQRQLPIDAIEVCEHDDADQCLCRKPMPGLLTATAARDGLLLRESFMVGDRWRDIDAGCAAGCRTILIGDAYNEPLRSQPDVMVTSLGDAVKWILAQSERGGPIA
jgi:D-glycero-D-manno-heptose 1,7-bisphosphate phosphatase